MIKRINERILKATINAKITSKQILENQDGNGTAIALVIGGVLLLAAVAAAPTITTFFTNITTYVTTFFDTEIKAILN